MAVLVRQTQDIKSWDIMGAVVSRGAFATIRLDRFGQVPTVPPWLRKCERVHRLLRLYLTSP